MSQAAHYKLIQFFSFSRKFPGKSHFCCLGSGRTSSVCFISVCSHFFGWGILIKLEDQVEKGLEGVWPPFKRDKLFQIERGK